MRLDTLATVADHPAGRIRLAGSVCGVAACELVADRDEIVVGSGLECDLVIPDPLIPARAFRIRRRKCHAGTDADCSCRWELDSLGEARVYVNHSLTRHERLDDGDVLAIGCHDLEFHTARDAARNSRSNRNVSDICRRLVADRKPPAGFLEATPSRRHLRRARIAGRVVVAAACLALLALLLTPRRETFEATQEPLEISIADLDVAAEAVRSLEAVERRRFEAAAPSGAEALLAAEPPKLAELAAAPVAIEPDAPAPPAAPDSSPVEIEPRPAIPVAAGPRTPVAREPVRLAANATTPRRRVERQAAGGTAPGGLAAARPAATPAADPRPITREVAVAAPAPNARQLATDRSVTLGQIARSGASPVGYETIQGLRVPVARIAEQLGQLEVTAPQAAKPVADGTVTEAEMASSWKSGRFKRHAPGDPPPDADPPTSCFVSKADADGRPCLYVSFVCTDPDLGQLKASGAQGNLLQLIGDDSVEVFLDVDDDRVDYHQIIVNARGAFWTAFYAKPLLDGGQPQPWTVRPTVKTTINAAAGQWTCEIMIPFESLGGAPAAGTRWSVNFCRNFRGQGEDRQLQTWFAVFDGKRNFHHPSRFGVFQW